MIILFKIGLKYKQVVHVFFQFLCVSLNTPNSLILIFSICFDLILDNHVLRSTLKNHQIFGPVFSITPLKYKNQLYILFISGNYSVAGFELTLRRKVSHYIITYYLPSGMFVIVSWISFLVPPEIVPGRMTLLVTVFLVLVNIFNTITTNIPKAEGLTGTYTYMYKKWARN